MGVGAAIVVLIGGFAVVVVAGMLQGAVAPQTVPSATPTATIVPAGVYVHVEGAIRAPGLYLLPAGARVVDAVSAAGGFADDADQAGLNLARVLVDGEQLHVPAVGEAAASATAGGVTADGRVNINTADAAALDTLPRIGPALAQRIIDWREANGAFTSVDDLLAVTGIGDAILAGLRDLVTV
ncbi:MAG: ComEA family DNA-binding protein [Microbacterium sp.]|uniref:helix-hairpin-helix domain-containing protein n=1 Tax=Microbacterium sp. TaxID=51671 RepID=UPI0039E68D0A